ncbi:MAG: hypothetical protein KKC55_16480 [Gammaproteobacteria bacterium]|uniref:Uncharacterized protein n=1 Tax=viral metagenome TaxID=1070528 RepID=A0A6M3M682_9ZZZZ|nr:hypothetical protein [Gammaproteobacteria bacterium]
MAKSTQERSAKAAKKREQYDEKELRHKVRPGIHQAMDRTRTRSGTEEISEVLQLAILKMDAMTDAELIEFLKPPRHEVTISKTLRERFDNESRREAGHHSDDSEYEVIDPNRLPHGPDECAKAQLDILSQE